MVVGGRVNDTSKCKTCESPDWVICDNPGYLRSTNNVSPDAVRKHERDEGRDGWKSDVDTGQVVVGGKVRQVGRL
jgi:hypothetical protein